MVPYSFTVTSHLIVTFGLSFSLFIGITLVGFQTHGIHFFSLLLPKGAPLILAPLLVVLELVSYCFRAVSLGVRLFANIMAGHTLLAVIFSFNRFLLTIKTGFIATFLIPIIVLPCLLLVIALIGLEFGVALIQAYVFSILTSIYINDSVHIH